MQDKNFEKQISRRLQAALTPLEYLVYNHEGTVEDIAKAAGKDYTTILRMIRHLEKKGFVKMNRLERTGEKGRERRYYRITIYGLEAFLACYLDFTGALPDIRRIANAHQDMLLSFAKWQKFVDEGCEKACIENLKQFVRVDFISRYIIFPAISGKILMYEKEENLRKMYDWCILGFSYMNFPLKSIQEHFTKKGLWEDMLKLWCVVEKDYELRRLRDEYWFFIMTGCRESLKSIQEWQNFFSKNLEKQN